MVHPPLHVLIRSEVQTRRAKDILQPQQQYNGEISTFLDSYESHITHGSAPFTQQQLILTNVTKAKVAVVEWFSFWGAGHARSCIKLSAYFFFCWRTLLQHSGLTFDMCNKVMVFIVRQLAATPHGWSATTQAHVSLGANNTTSISYNHYWVVVFENNTLSPLWQNKYLTRCRGCLSTTRVMNFPCSQIGIYLNSPRPQIFHLGFYQC